MIALPSGGCPIHSRWLTSYAWAGMLLLSRLPQILAQELLGINLQEQILWLWLGGGVVLIGITLIRPEMQFLCRYFVLLTAIYGATILLENMTAMTIWQSWFGGSETSWAIRFFGERLSVVLLAASMMTILFLMGQSHHKVFLQWGNWRVPTGLHLLSRPESLTWAVVGPSVALGLAIFFGWGLVRINLSFFLDYQQLIWLAPFVLLFALMNAFGEEMAYRAGPLSQLWPVVGERQAIWITAVWFGLGHYYGGIPSGAMGALMAGGVALLFGKAMVETRGIALPILMHMLVDVVIYTFLALTAP